MSSDVIVVPGALWTQCNGANEGGELIANDVRFFVLHVAQSPDQSGVDAWFKNPAAQVSAHFSIDVNGEVHQYVSLNRQAWAQADYNDAAISIEHIGYSGEQLTKRALHASLDLLDELARRFPRVPLRRSADVDGRGVIGHGELGVKGGDHPDCPGNPILGQFDRDFRARLAATRGR